MAKYAGSPIAFFLSLPSDEFMDWIQLVSKEITRENNEIRKARNKKG